jgi:hypothetical protein
MAEQTNFLLGKGELLTGYVDIRKSSGEKKVPYTFEEARHHLARQAVVASRAFDSLPAAACPGDVSVGVLTLHPAFMAKSYFPTDLLSRVGLSAVGSKAATITPRKWTKKGAPQACVAPEIYVAGARSSFRDLAASLPQWTAGIKAADELIEIEDLRAPTVQERVKPFRHRDKMPLMEIVLHSMVGKSESYTLDGFQEYLRWLKLDFEVGRHFSAKGLCFVALRCPRDRTNDVAQFSFLRACREMPTLRHFRVGDGKSATSSIKPGFVYDLPDAAAVDPHTVAAIFDGGIPYMPKLSKWTQAIDPPGIGATNPKSLEHGLAVTSAFLFGSMSNGRSNPAPFCRVDHYRVIDAETAKEPQAELYGVLDRIVKVLKKKKYPFVNLSVGPDTPVEDDDINGWTAAIDECLSDGTTLLTSAVGNEGEADAVLHYNRIQPPSDCVNVLAVGACDSLGAVWHRAPYSCVGPGRSPGRIKPDLVAFGGSESEPFFVMAHNPPNYTAGRCGTSYSSPLALRAATAVRAHFGSILNPLAIRALLLHRSRTAGHDAAEVGRGRLCHELTDLMTCSGESVTTIYQEMLAPKQYLRAFIPYPVAPLIGFVTISATLCFATDTDPKDTLNYTRSGVDITLRPHADKFAKPGINKKTGRPFPNPKHPKSAAFFSSSSALLEGELRDDEHKWETVLHASERFQAGSLKDPMLDIHYNPREGGADATDPKAIPYALVVTMTAPKSPSLYNSVVTRYPGILMQLKPVIAIPIRT